MPQPHRAERQVARRQGTERRAALHAVVVQVQRQRLVRRPAFASVDRRSRGRRREADHLRRRMERHGPAVVAERRTHRVRVRPHRQGVRRRPQLGRLDDPGRRLHVAAGVVGPDGQLHHESLIGGRAGQSAALVARRRFDRLRHGRSRGSTAAARDRASHGRRRDAARADSRSHSDRSPVGERRRTLFRYGREGRAPAIQDRAGCASADAGDDRIARRAVDERRVDRSRHGLSGERFHAPRRRLCGAARRKEREEALEPQRGAAGSSSRCRRSSV